MLKTTVRWMIPNSGLGAGVVGDAILRGREYGRGTGQGGRVVGSGLTMLSLQGGERPERQTSPGFWSSGQAGVWAGE